jgi:hypothetical protein
LYFFQAHALRDAPPVHIELTKIYRQTDPDFVALLNRLRYNEPTRADIDRLNQHFNPNFTPDYTESYITLTTHNWMAARMNEQELRAIPEEPYVYPAFVKGEFPESMYPCDPKLVLKEGAQVMFIKNDTSGEGRYYNGKLAKVYSLSEKSVYVKTEDGLRLEVEAHTWENIRYSVDNASGSIRQDVIGSYTQFPLRLAWAMASRVRSLIRRLSNSATLAITDRINRPALVVASISGRSQNRKPARPLASASLLSLSTNSASRASRSSLATTTAALSLRAAASA